MKPNWNTAPKWAQWLCMNRYGQWYWCAEKPSLSFPSTGWSFRGQNEMIVDRNHALVHQDGYQSSLEKRPA